LAGSAFNQVTLEFGQRLAKLDKTLQAVVIGNGESRKPIDLEKYRSTHTIIGCNALHRDTLVDHLVCCDRRMVDEAIVNPNIGDTLIYVRKSWHHFFRKILKNKKIQHLPPIPTTGEAKQDQSDHWGSGCYAILLAAYLGFKEVNLIGFDLYPSHDQINNIYKGTQNYAKTDARAVDYSFWVYQTSQIFRHYSQVQFIVHNRPDWDMPKEWQKNNVKFLAL
jgi:hypothetical protein